MSSIDVGDQRVPVPAAPNFNSDDNWGKNRLLKTDEAKRAAAIATGVLISDIAATSQSQQTVDNAHRILSELSEGLTGPAPQAQQFAPAPQQVPVPEAPAVPLDYELPPEVAAMLAEPDEPNFDTPDEPEAVVEVQVDDDPDEFVDPEVARLRKELAAQTKKAEYERSLRVQTARKDWEAEAARVFTINGQPLLNDEEITAINADSHKDFLRQAKAKADANKEIAQRFVTAAPQAPVQIIQRPDVWGTPTVGDPSASADSVSQQQRLQAARRSGRLADSLKVLIYPDNK